MSPKVPIEQVDPNTLDVVATHASISHAAKTMGYVPSALNMAVRKGFISGGFIWRTIPVAEAERPRRGTKKRPVPLAGAGAPQSQPAAKRRAVRAERSSNDRCAKFPVDDYELEFEILDWTQRDTPKSMEQARATRTDFEHLPQLQDDVVTAEQVFGEWRDRLAQVLEKASGSSFDANSVTILTETLRQSALLARAWSQICTELQGLRSWVRWTSWREQSAFPGGKDWFQWVMLTQELLTCRFDGRREMPDKQPRLFKQGRQDVEQCKRRIGKILHDSFDVARKRLETNLELQSLVSTAFVRAVA